MLRFIGFYDYTVILTYLGVLSTVIGMCFAVSQDYLYAIICLLISGLCDMFDGTVDSPWYYDGETGMFVRPE